MKRTVLLMSALLFAIVRAVYLDSRKEASACATKEQVLKTTFYETTVMKVSDPSNTNKYRKLLMHLTMTCGGFPLVD